MVNEATKQKNHGVIRNTIETRKRKARISGSVVNPSILYLWNLSLLKQFSLLELQEKLLKYLA